MPTQDVQKAMRAALEDEREHLRSQVDSLAVGSDDYREGYDNNFADSGQVAAGQNADKSLATTMSETLRDVDHALEKLEGGTYGTCEVCDREIAEARLEAMPSTRYCIDHAVAR